MTRERKLAIKMWEEVKERLPRWYDKDPWSIVLYLKDFKIDFCCMNNLHWRFDCWFCQYIRFECDKCPLRSCNHAVHTTAWARIVNENTSLEIKLQAWDDIIAALKGGIDGR